MVELLIPQRQHSIGAFEVGRVLPFRQRRMVGPFIFFDRMGPQDLTAPVGTENDVLPHPHIGLSTVTYLFEGAMTHRDSLGVEQDITPGALNWMTAGSGISHSERFEPMRAQGGRMDGIQAWVALPEHKEEQNPDFVHYEAEQLPLIKDTGLEGRLIAGSALGLCSPASVASPLFYMELRVQAGQSVPLPTGHEERAIYICAGGLEVGGQRYPAGQMLVFAKGGSPRILAEQSSHLMLLGGEPLGPRHIWWNFVSSRKDRIEQAKDDWVNGRISLPPLDDDQFIPLPAV
ncbi:pirin family protein [Alcaligenes faecalis]|uniref:pirin family protein n=1 Tax=Alcaligenes faecalis TaxID=511 RepID=UPI0005A8A7C8|nr:pirin family protein [Alcaligenes faecalis]ATI00062.1 pirin family protein [Alcaligenes faecalis]AYZ92848.1 pirin family protein [Alcaligenes faecalis]MCX5593618.1 pirin family protein [Alcaligenes faecalis]QQC31350.1 pirin family protein [Alcaligenes faecalis]CAJ0905914.1 Pirin-like protein CC_3178 [Alcaligenes faecalis subsp. faecalis]